MRVLKSEDVTMLPLVFAMSASLDIRLSHDPHCQSPPYSVPGGKKNT